MRPLWLFLVLAVFYVYKVMAQTSIIGAKMSGASGAIVQETGTMVLEFSDSGITFADSDTITVVLPTGTSVGTSTPTCTEQLGEFTVSS